VIARQPHEAKKEGKAAMIHIRPMTPADLPAGLHLSRQAGWNQTETDWQRCFGLEPAGCFIAEHDNVVAGTTTTCIFGSVAWVAMVLVEQRFRRRGIGRALMEHALAFLDERGAATVRLDATPLGQPLYEQLGFVPQFRLERWAGVLADFAGPVAPEIVTPPPEEWPLLARLDASVTKTDRSKFLQQLFAEQPDRARAVFERGEARGLLCTREGANAVQVGPCLGPAALPLLEDECRRLAGRPVFLDIPELNASAGALARRRGLAVQRSLLRMCRGEAVVEAIDLLWTSSGPEKG
jgi:GNAT superfamily N-acetyltransferase